MSVSPSSSRTLSREPSSNSIRDSFNSVETIKERPYSIKKHAAKAAVKIQAVHRGNEGRKAAEEARQAAVVVEDMLNAIEKCNSEEAVVEVMFNAIQKWVSKTTDNKSIKNLVKLIDDILADDFSIYDFIFKNLKTHLKNSDYGKEFTTFLEFTRHQAFYQGNLIETWDSDDLKNSNVIKALKLRYKSIFSSISVPNEPDKKETMIEIWIKIYQDQDCPENLKNAINNNPEIKEKSEKNHQNTPEINQKSRFWNCLGFMFET